MPVSVTTKILPDRPLMPAMTHGLACACPSCGKGKLFRAYLKTVETCAQCGTDLHHHRADDLPPYLAILIVGHVLVGLMIHLDMSWHISPMTYLIVMVPLAIVLPLMILPSLKGLVVGIQWSKRMHGFGSPEPASPEA